MWKYTKTDDQLRTDILAAGGADDISSLEEILSRHWLADREEYRANLEMLARKYRVDRGQTLARSHRASAARAIIPEKKSAAVGRFQLRRGADPTTLHADRADSPTDPQEERT